MAMDFANILLALLPTLLLMSSLAAGFDSYKEAPHVLTDRPVPEQGCERACGILLQHDLFFVYTSNTTDYNHSKANYWSTFQSDASPACFVHPTNAQNVAYIINHARLPQCVFAVKSGGHAAFTGASNAPYGMTVELAQLNPITLSDDHQIASVGTGALCIDVYDYLTPLNLSVLGGRVSDIGVGGLTLGGGISFFSGRYGWACDRVSNYEVVIANGSIFQVNYGSHPDLYWALRGGGNNFGIVTRMDFETIPISDMWGGTLSWSISKRNEVISAFYHQASSHRFEGPVIADHSLDTMAWVAFAYLQDVNQTIITSTITYAQPEPYPSVLSKFTDIQPTLDSGTLRMTNVTDLARELNDSNPSGFRETYWTFTIYLGENESMLQAAVDIFLNELEVSGITNIYGILPVLVMQHIRTSTIVAMSTNGGNALGLDAEDGPLTMFQISTWWGEDKERDDDVMSFARNCVRRWKEKSRELGVHHIFLYQNYAAKEQKVFEGYGQNNTVRLKAISEEWDPNRVWQRYQPGYLKLWEQVTGND